LVFIKTSNNNFLKFIYFTCPILTGSRTQPLVT